jgi:hypothetical protein
MKLSQLDVIAPKLATVSRSAKSSVTTSTSPYDLSRKAARSMI